jgi:hypothetical protein
MSAILKGIKINVPDLNYVYIFLNTSINIYRGAVIEKNEAVRLGSHVR